MTARQPSRQYAHTHIRPLSGTNTIDGSRGFGAVLRTTPAPTATNHGRPLRGRNLRVQDNVRTAVAAYPRRRARRFHGRNVHRRAKAPRATSPRVGPAPPPVARSQCADPPEPARRPRVGSAPSPVARPQCTDRPDPARRPRVGPAPPPVARPPRASPRPLRMPEACQRVAGGRSAAQTTGSRRQSFRPLARGRTHHRSAGHANRS